MIILPAIDLYGGKTVRLTNGDYDRMSIYKEDPVEMARSFVAVKATQAHIVDLEGARDGTTANFETIRRIREETGLDIEVGGGIRTAEVVEKYLNIGVTRVILGTAAITQPGFVRDMAREFGDKIAVSVDIKDGFVAIRGWTETTDTDAISFCHRLEDDGVKTIICTDISKDGALSGTNLDLYRTLSRQLSVNIIASGGVTDLREILTLIRFKLFGVILGKALYEGKIHLREALILAREASR